MAEQIDKQHAVRAIVYVAAGVVAFGLGYLATINDGVVSTILMSALIACAVAIVRGFRGALLIALIVSAAGAIGTVAHYGTGMGGEMALVLTLFETVRLLLPIGVVAMLTVLIVEMLARSAD